MTTVKTVLGALTITAALGLAAAPARAECNCVAVAGEVAAKIQAEVARADGLYARGDYDAALAIYADAYASSNDAALLYAQAMCHWQLGAAAEAEATFEAYLAAGGKLAHRERAEAAIAAIGSGATRAVVDVTGAAVGGADRLRGDLEGGIGAGVGAGAGAGAAVVGRVDGAIDGVTAKPKKVAKGAAIVLGVVAVAAVGAVAVQGISAGIDEEIDFDKKFGLGMGLSGVVVGATAVYLWGLTTTAGATAAAPCVGDGTPVITPVAYPSGAGVAAALSF